MRLNQNFIVNDQNYSQKSIDEISLLKLQIFKISIKRSHFCCTKKTPANSKQNTSRSDQPIQEVTQSSSKPIQLQTQNNQENNHAKKQCC